MSGSNREEILANFQEVTGMENVEEAIMWLENFNWDLLSAIKSALPQEMNDQDRMLQVGHGGTTQLATNGVPVTISSDFIEMPSTSGDSHKNQPSLHIHVFYLNNEIKVQVPESLTVGCLKTIIYSETGVPPCQQELTGWLEEPTADTVSLSKLNLPSVVYLRLNQSKGSTVIGDQHGGSPMEVVDNSETIYVLKIYDELNNKEYNLKLPGDKNVSQVKADTFTLTDIPARHQIWCGWPENITDDSKLYELDLDQPFHCLTVQSSNIVEESPLNNSVISISSTDTPPSPIFIDLADTDSSPEDFEDASEGFAVEEEMFNDITPRASRPSPLIPDNVEDETAGSVHFIDGYNQRYGQSAPSFFPGTLEDAIKEACFRPARERRMLAIYLHHDGSVLTNVFCTELLGFETVLQTFANYFVVWGWDITNQGNREMFLSSVTRLLGSTVTETVQSISIDLLPALVIISRSRANTELLNVIYGNIGINELLTMLIHAVDVFTEIQETESKEEEERAAREKIKSEQDRAYQASLQLDRAKDEAKKQQMLLQSQEEERLKKEQEMEEERRKAERLAVESQLPQEPIDDGQVITFRFRPPKGEMFERKFLPLNKLQVLFNYLLVKGYRIEEYKLISPWPRRELSSFDGETLLRDIGLCAQETIILEER